MTTNGDFFDDNGQAGALKARLLGWEGYIGPLWMGSFRAAMVGKEFPVKWLDGDTAWLETPSEFVAWPVSRLELVQPGRGGAEG